MVLCALQQESGILRCREGAREAHLRMRTPRPSRRRITKIIIRWRTRTNLTGIAGLDTGREAG